MKKYWLKSIGTSKHWIEKHLFAGFEEEIHFPYEPKSIQEGDWLLLYAVGHKRVIGLFEVTSTVKQSPLAHDLTIEKRHCSSQALLVDRLGLRPPAAVRRPSCQIPAVGT